MNVGLHFLENSYNDLPFQASTYLNVAGKEAGRKSSERLERIFFKGRPSPALVSVDVKVSLKEDPGARIQLGNEPNLETEGFGGGPEDYARWFLDIRDRVKEARLYYAGMSPGVPNWQDWYLHPKAQEAISSANGIAVHAYGNLAEVMSAIEPVRFFNKPLWVAELNFAAGRSVDRNAWARAELKPILNYLSSVGVEAVTYFAYKWPTPDMHLPTPVDAEGTEILSILRNWLPVPVPVPPIIVNPTIPPVVILPSVAFNAAERRDRIWNIAEEFEKNGYSWTGQGLKAVLALSKGDR